LAAEARTRRQAPGGVEPVRFVVLHLAEVLFSLFDDHVAGRAGAAAAAGVLEGDAEILGQIEKRFGLAVMGVRHLTVLELDDRLLAVDDVCDFGHVIARLKPSRSICQRVRATSVIAFAYISLTFLPDNAA